MCTLRAKRGCQGSYFCPNFYPVPVVCTLNLLHFDGLDETLRFIRHGPIPSPVKVSCQLQTPGIQYNTKLLDHKQQEYTRLT